MTLAPVLPADERERLNRALAGSAVDPFFILVENSRDAVFISSPELEGLYVNAAWEEIWGQSRESLADRPAAWMEAIHPEDRAWLLDSAAKAATQWSVEFRVIRPDGSMRWIRSRGFPIPDAQGRLQRVVGFAEDVTEWKRREESLLEAKDAAERASRAKSEFLANMSHELRTPLNSIIGFSEILADGDFGVLNERQAVYVENVLASGRHLLELINDLLDLSRIEADRADLAVGVRPGVAHPRDPPVAGARRRAGGDPSGPGPAGGDAGGLRRPAPDPAGRLQPAFQRPQVHSPGWTGDRPRPLAARRGEHCRCRIPLPHRRRG